MMRKWLGIAAAVGVSAGLLGGCDISKLFTAENIKAASEALKKLGVSVKFNDASGNAQNLNKSNIKSITDRKTGKLLELGKDYDFDEDGNLFFVGEQDRDVEFETLDGSKLAPGTISKDGAGSKKPIAFKDVGIALKYVGKDGKVRIVQKRDEIEKITLGDRTLVAGKDWDVRNGKLIFRNLSPEEQKKVNVTLKGGLLLKDISADAQKGDQTHSLIPDAEGNYDTVEGDEDPEEAFKKFLALSDKSRVTVKLPSTFQFLAADVIGLGFKPGLPAGFTPPPGTQLPRPILLPDFAVKGLDGGVKFDVQALGHKEEQGDDLKARIWILGYKIAGDKIKVVAFKITKTLNRAPREIDPKSPPAAQTVESKEVTIEAGYPKVYDNKEAAAEGEDLEEAIPPQPPSQG